MSIFVICKQKGLFYRQIHETKLAKTGMINLLLTKHIIKLLTFLYYLN